MLFPTRTRLSNGVRIVTVHMPDVPTMTLRVMIKAGSAFETESQQGISHFAEHVLFQGTESWPSFSEIGRAIETAGGIINGMTSRLITTYWVKALPERLPLAFDVLSEIVLRPRLDAKDVDHERDIIIEEIHRGHDRPEERVRWMLTEALWPDQPMGREIAGRPETLKDLGRDELRTYLDQQYTSRNLLIAAAGPTPHEELVRLVEQHFGGMAPGPETPLPDAHTVGELDVRIDTHPTAQVHLAMGFPSFGYQDPRIHTAEVLATLLGRGLSSRLFLAVRQRLGVAYSIGASQADFVTTGALQIAGGIRTNAIVEAVRAIMDELTRLREEPAGEEDMERARALEKAQLLFALERAEGMAAHFGTQELLLGRTIPVPTEIHEIERVHDEDVQALARELFDVDSLKLAVAGAVDREELLAALGR